MFIIPSVLNCNLDGIWVSLFLAIIFGLVHFDNLRNRKYCLAKWSFDGTAFYVHMKGMDRKVEISHPFCVCTTMLSFSRRCSAQKYPFIMVWNPGAGVAYEEMNGYRALKVRDAVIIPLDEQSSKIFSDTFGITNTPSWPKSRVCNGFSNITHDC